MTERQPLPAEKPFDAMRERAVAECGRCGQPVERRNGEIVYLPDDETARPVRGSTPPVRWSAVHKGSCPVPAEEGAP